MSDMVWHYLELLTRNANSLERQHWILISVVVLGVGLVCLRGFGSRTNY
jgi:hypothetical protein